MRVIAFMPVLGRRPLLIHTITRLYKVNKVDLVICAGDDLQDEEDRQHTTKGPPVIEIARGGEIHKGIPAKAHDWQPAIQPARKTCFRFVGRRSAHLLCPRQPI